MARILLILRGVHTRVVSHADNHTAVDACVGHCEQRVSRDVKTYVLHTAG